MRKKDIYVLGIESSCDETAAAVVKNGRQVLSNIIASQIMVHRKFGGVVPEIASRKHVEHVLPVIDEALSQAGVSLPEIDAVAVTYGPGLVGALLVGLSAAKSLAWAADKPLIGVNHLEGHVFANFLTDPGLEPPFLALVVSGGHTALLKVTGYNSFSLLGQTRTTRQAKPLIKSPASWGCRTPAARKLKSWRWRAIRTPLSFRGLCWTIRMNSASAA
jgi:N6-L-threonylcarbamoyladenine synthase